MNIESDQHFQDLIISRNLRKSSIKEYAKSLNQYCVFINKNPTELIEEAENQEDQQIRMKNRNIKRYLLDYYKYLKDRDLRYNTIKKQLAVIKTFYHEYDIETPRFKLVKNEILETVYSTDLPGHDEIKLILNNCNKKYQAIICTMGSSGMGRAEIQHLRIKDFFNAVNYKGNMGEINSILDTKDINQVALWKVIRYKTSMPYVTFSSPESIKLLQTRLQQLGYYKYRIDGEFLGGTFASVKAYQHSKGLLEDGIAGPITLKSLGLITTPTQQYRPVIICSDNINGIPIDKKRINDICEILTSKGLKCSYYGLGPNTHIQILQSSNTPNNALVVDIYGGADSGLIYEMSGKWYKSIKANRKVFTVFCCGAKKITGLDWLPRAHDDNYDPASFTGISHPDQFLHNNGYNFIESSDVNQIAAVIIKEATL